MEFGKKEFIRINLIFFLILYYIFMKYLIYKGTGGLVHMLNGIQSAVLLCKKENRILIIDTDQLSAFKKNFDEYFFIYDKELTYFTNYENIDLNLEFNGLKINDIIHKKAQFRDGKYYLEGSDIRIQKHVDGNEEDVLRVYAGHSECFIENIRLQNNILYNIFDSTIKTIEQYNQYISVHFRNTDMKNNMKDFIIKIKNACAKYNISNVFIATDDYYAFNTFKNFLPKVNFFRMHEVENFNGKNIHYNYQDKDLLIKNTLRDIYMIIKSNYFIPSLNSGISKWIIYQKENTEHRIFDDEFNFEVL